MSNPHPVPIGKRLLAGSDATGGPVRLDVPRLLASRALITATSGGGKSWLMRGMIEHLAATTQTLVIDPEGEFASLRELHDMVLVGPDGDLPADPHSAGLLCRRLMEQNVSAVMDIYELTPANRRQFVANFLTEMVNLPKTLWRPCFVVIDEVHEFAPNTKDKAYVSGEPVALLFSKGRKRGFCPIVATQRLSKLSMDVAAEAKNRFIGQTVLDVDQGRAADFLGWGKDRWPDLRDLSSRPGHEGEWFAVGPALSDRGVIKFRAGPVRTTHPRPGQGHVPEPPAPSKRIAGVLQELRDLPQQAAAEIRGLAEAKARIAELEGELKRVPAPAPVVERDKPRRIDAVHIHRLQIALETAMEHMKKANDLLDEAATGAFVDPEDLRAIVEDAVAKATRLTSRGAERYGKRVEQIKQQGAALIERFRKLLDGAPELLPPEPGGMAREFAEGIVTRATMEVAGDFVRKNRETAAAVDPEGRAGLTDTERAVLDAAASFPGGATRQRISIFSGRSIKSSTFKACFSSTPAGADKQRPSLVQRGLLKLVAGDKFEPTEAGARLAEPTSGATLAEWLRKLQPSEANVLKYLAAHRGRRFTREQIGEGTSTSTLSSSFKGAFGALRELGLIDEQKEPDGTTYAAAPTLPE